MTLDEAKAAAHKTMYRIMRGDDTWATLDTDIDTLATVAYNVGKVAGWDENVKACVEAQRKAAEGIRERAAKLMEFNGIPYLADVIRALPLEEEKP